MAPAPNPGPSAITVAAITPERSAAPAIDLGQGNDGPVSDLAGLRTFWAKTQSGYAVVNSSVDDALQKTRCINFRTGRYDEFRPTD